MNNKYEITLLDEEEFKHYFPGERRYCQAVDFAISLGTYADYKRGSYFWLKNDIKTDNNQNVTVIDEDGSFQNSSICNVLSGVRPVIKFSQLEKYAKFVEDYGRCRPLFTIKFGEYPQDLVILDTNLKLEEAFNSGKLKKTGKVYTTAGPCIDEDGEIDIYHDFEPFEHIEYEYNGSRYIRVANFNSKIISDDIFIKNYFDDYKNIYWVQVEPIIWLADVKNNIAISKYSLLGGFKFHYTDKNNNYVKFKDTTIYSFLNKYFAKEILRKEYDLEDFYSKDVDYNISYNDTVSQKFK